MKTKVIFIVIAFTPLACLTGLPAQAQIEGECIEITRVEHPTVRKLEDENYTLKIWSDDLLKWIGQDVSDQSDLGQHGEDYLILTFNVWFRNTCDRFAAIRPSVFIFEDAALMNVTRPLKEGVNRAPELIGPGVFEPYWLFFDSETKERTLCSGWELHWDRPAVLDQLGCGVIITAASYSPDSTYRIGLSGYECAIPEQDLGGDWEVSRNDKACGVSKIDTPAGPPSQALKLDDSEKSSQMESESDAQWNTMRQQLQGRAAGEDRRRHEDDALTREQRAQVQRGLSALGFDAGPSDGVFGPRTRSAIRDWQQAKGAEATGYLTREEVEALQGASGEVHHKFAMEGLLEKYDSRTNPSREQALPSHIVADQYLLEAVKALEIGEPHEAIRALEKIEALDIEPPAEFAHIFGKVLVESGTSPEDILKGRKLLESYVVRISRNSELYASALELLSHANRTLEKMAEEKAGQEAETRRLRAEEEEKREREAHRLREGCPDITGAFVYTDSHGYDYYLEIGWNLTSNSTTYLFSRHDALFNRNPKSRPHSVRIGESDVLRFVAGPQDFQYDGDTIEVVFHGNCEGEELLITEEHNWYTSWIVSHPYTVSSTYRLVGNHLLLRRQTKLHPRDGGESYDYTLEYRRID